MSYWEDMIQAIENVGEPDKLANGEDLIILKLKEPLPNGHSVPTPLTVDTGRSVLTMCQKDLANCRGFLAKQCYSTVLFSGLPELKSTKGFLAAARDVVFKSPELIIVHNRDRLVDLVYWFSKVTRLILYHDLVLQTESTTQVPQMPLTSHLVQVWGSTAAIGAEELFLCPITLLMLLTNCPGLSEVHAPLDEMLRVAEDFKRRSPHFPPLFGDRRELTLGSYLRRPCRNVIMMHSTTLPCMKKAIEWNPNLERLQLTTSSQKVLACIPRFSQLKRLSIMYGPQNGWCPFDPHLSNVLRILSLTHLTIKYFEGVRLSTINNHCPNIECLSLLGCKIADETIRPGSFAKLKSLALSDSIMEEAFFTLLNIVKGLTDLYLDGEWIVSAYIGGPRTPAYQRPIHPAMEQLTILTDLSVPALHIVPEEVRRLIGWMPRLKRLSTDSYDIRLCVQNYFPHVALTWTSCTTCAAEFPKMNFAQHEIWRIVHAPDLEDEKNT
ncbi:uncharacterized protein LOC119175918 [Rhipicephalus microplus]|uniref:Protein ovary overexpressed n=2 Tax=Rhipicephalus microplus TaxID=6941 RepID=A0A6M2D1P3_RHIMP